MLQMQGVWTLLWCPTRDKKIAFICEKELTIMNKAEEGETTESTHEEEHLGASELPSCVIHRVYYCQGGTLAPQSLRPGGYYKYLVQWKHRSTSDSAWIKGTELQRLHPDLFTAYVNHNLPESSSSKETTIDANQETEEGVHEVYWAKEMQGIKRSCYKFISCSYFIVVSC